MPVSVFISPDGVVTQVHNGLILLEQLRNLVRLGLLVALEDGIYYPREMYDSLSALVLDGYSKGGRFTIPQAKARTGLSRKYVIPLLNKMEEEGRVKRDGNERVVSG